MAYPYPPLHLGRYELKSRLITGSGKYSSFDVMVRALDASGCDCITVAVRRVNLNDKSGGSLLDHIDRKRYTILPNTAGCYSADEAVRTARLAREAGLSDLVKLEVIGDQATLAPDPVETLKATRTLVAEGFTVLAYTNDDLIMALRLEEAGATSVMPLGAPIGSGLGILNPHNIRTIIERCKVPVIVDAGVGTASDVTVAMELGAAGVLLNSGIALAQDPVAMARAMGLALDAGWLASRAGRIPRRTSGAAPSSPTTGLIQPAARSERPAQEHA